MLRHLIAIAVLPFTVTVLIPSWMARRFGVSLAIGRTLPQIALQLAGLVLLSIGLLLFLASLRRFASEGQGTLAPWDPPRSLVVRGPYRFVRNPMISGVIFVLLGEAALLRSWAQGAWAALFIAVNAIVIPLYEERLLERRFGEDYRAYCRRVPRFIPRLRP